MQRKIRVLVAKPGLDGHDRGAKVVAAALRDAGMEVIYTGLHQSPEQVVEAALQEDVDVVALSILSGAHMTLFPDVLKRMAARGLRDRLLTGGGIIPQEDMESLAKLGVGKLFGPGSSTQDIADYIRAWFVSAHGEGSLAPAPKRAAVAVAIGDEAPAHHAAARRAPARAAPPPARSARAAGARAAAPARARAAAAPTRARAAARPGPRRKAAAKVARRKSRSR